MKYDFSGLEARGKAAAGWLVNELGALRTGRATPALLDPINVEAYAARTPLKHVAAITVEDARTLRVTPWDPSILKAVETAIAASSLGVSPVADKASVRLVLPELTDDRRRVLTRLLSEKLEEAKIMLRRGRDEVWKEIQEKERAGAIPEDDKFRLKEEMEKIAARFSEEFEALAERKRGEIAV